ncbi:chromatin remodeling complex subunit [Medicago truncatula]|uniref:Chromatin remodeling complex subunit n=1 Tax=Medicago truncatula TaxID=3880 RepID=G7L120_MEDTR|nr:chromatin remodeling complex subunit [Medicago truncatula]
MKITINLITTFEAIRNDSWQPVELIKIDFGKTTLHFMDTQQMQTPLSSDIRIRSRKATSFDCSSFLRRGMDISMLQISDQFRPIPTSIDARINSIQRQPHESDQCSCQFYVNFYEDQGSLGRNIKTLNKEVYATGIDRIFILQRLQHNSCEGLIKNSDSSEVVKPYRWDSSEDCSSLSESRLILGRFLSDLSWFVTTSFLKKVSFSIRSVQNKIFYHVMGNDADIINPSLLNVVNFKSEKGSIVPVVSLFDMFCDYDGEEDEALPMLSNQIEGLRRSKRRNVQPKRYIGSSVEKLEVGTFRMRPYKIGCYLIEDENSSDLEVDDNVTLGHYYSFCKEKPTKRRLHGSDDMDFETKWEGIRFKKGAQTKRNHSICLTNRSHVQEGGRTLNVDAKKEIIDTYMKNLDSLRAEEEPTIDEETNKLEEEKVSKSDDGEENPDDLSAIWEEMDTAMAASCLLDGTEGSNAEVLADTEEICEHDYTFNEEIGIFCLSCGSVKTEIRDISEPVVERQKWRKEEKQYSEEDNDEQKSEAKVDEDDNKDMFSTNATDPDEPISAEKDTVWESIPELKEKMHAHQKKAFKFLWQNIAGSMEPSLMQERSETNGGCVISHAPGAGKTFLVISFLVSYLKLFPGKRPLVLAPKSTLYTWCKEFKKWKVPVPVYLIQGRQTQRDSTAPKPTVLPGVPRPSGDVKHVLDCLGKIKKWHSHPSVLVMGYTSFLALMRQDTKFAHRKYMAKTLRESPGILILDEGHNPRSTKSRLRKCLMELPTELRILLSGTLFQNNFGEYFNTLCLARPKFVHEVLRELDSKYLRRGNREKKAQHLLEARARKFFLDNIARKINSDNDEEKMQGLHVLRKITSSFIDVYESGNSSDTLPGLQIYTLLMNTYDEQLEILQKLQKKMAECTGYPLEVELLITLGSIHPWLIKTATACAEKFFAEDELKRLDRIKFDLRKGSKIRFVLSLISRVVKNEKVLIFCHYLAPVRFFIELFEKYFQWQNGKEVLILTGDLDLFERGKVIDKFEDPRSGSKILLASINACAEGISLTAASRVIFLDSEWNPSKTKQAIARAFRPGQQKMVYVYQLLTTGSMEEDKFRKTTWKEWVSSMIFSEEFVEDPSKWQAEKIEDEILREMVEEDKSKAIHMIMKNEKDSVRNMPRHTEGQQGLLEGSYLIMQEPQSDGH